MSVNKVPKISDKAQDENEARLIAGGAAQAKRAEGAPSHELDAKVVAGPASRQAAATAEHRVVTAGDKLPYGTAVTPSNPYGEALNDHGSRLVAGAEAEAVSATSAPSDRGDPKALAGNQTRKTVRGK